MPTQAVASGSSAQPADPEKLFMRRAALALVAVTALGAVFYFWLLFTRWQHASQWGDFGSAVGPFVAVLNVGALLAALYSIALQREELRETRGEMFEQRKQFERTAEAQEKLAVAQERLAKAQEEANALARATAEIQRRANIVAATAAIPACLSAKANSADEGTAQSFSSMVDGLMRIVSHEIHGLGIPNLAALAVNKRPTGGTKDA